jgi:hypothetical protein
MVSPLILPGYVCLAQLPATIYHTCFPLLIECATNYHNNYSVHNDQRTYYEDKPTYVQAGEHQFVEHKLVDLWVNLMLVGW